MINADTGEQQEFNKFYECCGVRYEEPEPRFFSFNNPFGACPVCQGFSKVIGIDMNLVIPNPNLTIADGAIAPYKGAKYSSYLRDLIQSAREYKFPIHIPYKQLTDEQLLMVRKGFGKYKGLDHFFEELERKTYKLHVRVMLSRYRGYTICPACKGSRLRREALQVKIDNKSIHEVVQMPIEKSLEF
ncbi:MAG TPA: excinuclease ABC subunit A, partial [Ignavibacteriaceae bacterium]|nr:excinuclease ABC subunit A [Ignavibacteriaceae bacterium]